MTVFVQSRALGMIRSHVLSVLKNTSVQVNFQHCSLLFFNMNNRSIYCSCSL